MKKAIEIIDKVATTSERAILFHSASGKDSIALLDLLSKRFNEVICVYMYVVKDLSHINRYINYATNKYSNVKFVQIPHFAVYSYIKNGYMGHECNPDQKLYSMDKLTDLIREKYNIDWAFYGFKKTDSLNRRCMLKTYDMEAINEKTKKCYPLSSYKNSDILNYIKKEDLVRPERYGKSQSSGTDISDINYLLFLRDKYPLDLNKVLTVYPAVERLLFEYDYENKRNKDNKAVAD